MAKAKKRSPKVNATKAVPRSKAVRLDLPIPDHESLERIASSVGLSMASYVRMIVLERLSSEKERRGLK